MKQITMRLTRRCSAPPETVYDVVADLRRHLSWGGAQQRSDFRRLSLDAPAGVAAVGTSFRSTGAIPMSSRRWSDRSTVTVATRPAAFEFVTHATVDRPRRPMEAIYRHRYEIAAAPGGSFVIYTLTQLDVLNPFLRLALPMVRTVTWRLGLPFLAGRGFRSLVALAEQNASLQSAYHTT